MFKKITDTGAKTVRIVKPYADNGKVRDQFAFAEDAGAFGVGMDIDHIFGENGYDVVIGETMTAQTTSLLASYVESTKLPFVVKGVLCVFDAKKCAEIGAAAVGRSMLPHLESKGVEGVRELLENVGNELRYIMSSTGFKNPAEIDDSVLWMNPV